MKTYSILLVLVALISLFSASAQNVNYGIVTTDYNYIHVYTLKYEPYPVQPGRYADVWFKIENTGSDTVNKLAFKLEPKYPFSIDTNEKADRELLKLEGGQSALLHYKVRVDTNAVEGSNPLFYTITMDGGRQSSNVNIWVQTMDANVAVNAVKTDSIAPGEAKKVAIEVENMGDSPLSDINIKLDLSSEDNPFVPINSTSEIKLPFLEPRAKGDITFTLMALPNAKANTYKIPIETKFVDGTGKNYTRSSVIGLTVGAKPDISITVADSKIYGNGDNNIVSLKFTNKGLTDVKFLSVTLKDEKDYTVISENDIYLGNVDSDDYETADYRIKANKVKNNVLPLVIGLEYLDANNVKYAETRTVDMKVFSAKEQGIAGGNGFGTLIFLAILIGGGYYAYRRWEKKKLLRKK